jgi:hypothetical protein
MHFSSLKSIGSPQDIANLISVQKSEIARLTEALAGERASKQRDMSYAMKSMDCQLHASRNGALHERQQLGQDYENLKLEMKCELDANDRERIKEIQQLHEHYATELKLKTAFYEVRLPHVFFAWC